MIVTIGIRLLRKAWRSDGASARQAARPRREHVQLAQLLEQLARVIRARIAASAAPSVTAGSTRCASVPVPETGSQPSRTAKTIASSGPSQKFGIEIPTSASVIAAWSTHVPRKTAARMPSGIAKTMAQQHRRERQLRGVRQLLANLRRDRRVVRNDVPRSPRTTPPRNARYCVSSGRSRPSECRSLPHVLRRGAFAEHRLRRIAGHEMNQREHQRRDAEQHRDRQQQAADQVAEQLAASLRLCSAISCALTQCWKWQHRSISKFEAEADTGCLTAHA